MNRIVFLVEHKKEKRRDHRRLPLRGDEDEGDDAEKNSGQRERVSRALVRCPLKKNEETTRRFLATESIGGNDDDDDDKRAREHQYRGGEGGGGVQVNVQRFSVTGTHRFGSSKVWIRVSISGASLGDSLGTVRERLSDTSKVRDRENGRVRVQTFRLSFANERRRSSGRKCDG